MKLITIIIPIYAGYEETVSCIESVLSADYTSIRFRLLIVYDAGPDSNLEHWIDALINDSRIEVLKNEKNFGFVVSINRGLRHQPENDVLLLNSDTLVANNWLDRLYECAYSDDKIATVTPFSNNAEIFSFPSICENNKLPPDLSLSGLDKLFATNVEPAAVDVPTGVGFCMYIKRKALDEVGCFNEKLFGRGYGEENDFCRRLVYKGWRNVHCTNVFVYHVGSVSFSIEKARRVEKAMKVIDRLHPNYHRLVHEYIQRDEPKIYRIQAELAIYRNSHLKKIALFIHGLGGGTTKHAKEIAEYHQNQNAIVWIKPISSKKFIVQFRLEDSFPPKDGLCIDVDSDWRTAVELFNYLSVEFLHIHHIKGAEYFIQRLVELIGVPYAITLHDYYFINGNPTLSDPSGRFCDDLQSRDELCALIAAVPLSLTARDWRERIACLMEGAKLIIAPSEFTAGIYRQYFSLDQLQVHPHQDSEATIPYPSVTIKQPGTNFRVVVLGALSIEKGADILESTAKLAEKLGRKYEFILVGYAYRQLDKLVTTLGDYTDELLPNILKELKPDLIWFPSLWPETYSYTLSHALDAGLPVLLPDFGAFPERTRARPFSWIVSNKTSVVEWLYTIDEIRNEIESKTRLGGKSEVEVIWQNQPYSSKFYTNDYTELIVKKAVETCHGFDLSLIRKMLNNEETRLKKELRKEILLSILLRLREMPIFRTLLRKVPIQYQRRIKRLLSEREIHKIV